MTDQPTPEEKLNEEFRSLGKNLAEALRAAWDTPERKRVQQELENGLNELSASLKREADNFSESQTGQQLKADIHDLGERFRTGEAQNQVHHELLSALKTVNAELQKVIAHWSGGQGDAGTGETPPGETNSGKPEGIA
jgi:hypothetical protein